MRNYIKLNGNNSNDITGLLIQELPPITKPKIRTQIEEINGRDGDIVTNLGYSAYNKEISIGLYGNYNVDDVIAYFNNNKTGEVIFSNEPDKCYNYEIFEQIDFDRLIRFRTATVKMHVQPFKYPTEEEQITESATVITGEGNELSLNNTKEGTPLEIGLKGNTSQETTTGKNLIPNNLTNTTVQGVVATKYPNGSINFKGTIASGGDFTLFNKIDDFLVNGQTYTLSVGSNIGINVIFRMQDGTNTSNFYQIINNSASSDNRYTTFTYDGRFTSGKITLKFILKNAGAGNTIDITIYPMLESGSTATSYEPYTNGASPNPDYPQEVQVVTGDNTITISNSDNTQSQEYEINLGTLELCKIGTYQDYLYKSGENWYKHSEIAKTKLLSTWNWFRDNEKPNSWRFYSQSNTIPNSYNDEAMSNYFKGDTIANVNNIDSQAITTINYTQIALRINKTIAPTKDDLITWLSNTEVYIYTILSTPTEEQITNAELIEQLEAILNAVSYEDQTNISQENDNLGFIISASTSNMADITVINIGNIYAKPLMTINGSGNIEVYLNGVQVLQIALGDNQDITIDVSKMEAYNSSTQALLNRLVTGDYMKFLINSGNNTIGFRGSVTSVTIDNYTRYL